LGQSREPQAAPLRHPRRVDALFVVRPLILLLRRFVTCSSPDTDAFLRPICHLLFVNCHRSEAALAHCVLVIPPAWDEKGYDILPGSPMELRHLRYFVVVAEELNFCRAAERLRITQPPLSVQIRHLEDELGVQLFYRVKRRITLSPGGEVLFSQGRRLLRDAEQIADQVREAASGNTGSLSIGFVATAMYDILPAALRIFRSAFPNIRLNLEDVHSGQQIQALQGRKIDVGIVRPLIEDAFLETEEILREPLMVALPQKHWLHDRDQIPLTDLSEEPFLMCPMSSEPGLHRLYMNLTEDAGFRPRVVQQAEHIQTRVALVAAGVGVCLVPSSAMGLLQAGVLYRPLVAPQTRLTKLMIWRKGPCPAHLTGFLGAVRHAAALLRTEATVRRACRPAPRGFATALQSQNSR
jgi:DNA-binding transcriptional LysR family regulator